MNHYCCVLILGLLCLSSYVSGQQFLTVYNNWVSVNASFLPFQSNAAYTFCYQIATSNQICLSFVTLVSTSCSATTLSSAGVGLVKIALLLTIEDTFMLGTTPASIAAGAPTAPQTAFGTTAPNGQLYRKMVAWLLNGINLACVTQVKVTFTCPVPPSHMLYQWVGTASTAGVTQPQVSYKRSISAPGLLKKSAPLKRQSTSLLVNPQFSATPPSTGWTVTLASQGSSLHWVSGSQGPNGQGTWVQFGATASIPDSISQTVSTVPGHLYSLSFDLSLLGTGTANRFTVSMNEVGLRTKTLWDFVNSSSAFGWQPYSSYITVCTSSIILTFSGYNTGSFWALGLINLVDVTGLDSQLALNPSFDGDNINYCGWTVTRAPSNGGLYLLINANAAKTGPNYLGFSAHGSSPDTVSQQIPTVIGTTYVVTFWLWLEAANSANSFVATFGNTNLVNFANYESNFGWTFYAIPVQATSSNTNLVFSGMNNGGWWFLDAVGVIAQVPCTVDLPSRRDLPYYAGTDPNMSPVLCYNLCLTQGYAFMGLQNGTQCWCGDLYGQYGPATASSCSAFCPGDLAVYCGGVNVNSVYYIGDGFKLFNLNIQIPYQWTIEGIMVGSLTTPATALGFA